MDDPLQRFVAAADAPELQRLALVHGLQIDCDDREELAALLMSFFSFADRRTVIINELCAAFPALIAEADLIASLLESTGVCVSHALLLQLAEMSDSSAPFTLLQLGCDNEQTDVFAATPGAAGALVCPTATC
jgi:hypothetical protein